MLNFIFLFIASLLLPSLHEIFLNVTKYYEKEKFLKQHKNK